MKQNFLNLFVKKFINSIILFFMTATVFGQGNIHGIFSNHSDIGKVKYPGTVKYSDETSIYTISGSGTNMWFTDDEFHFVWKKMKGDFILRANMAFLNEGIDPHRKAGLIIRENLESNSPYADAVVHGDGLTSMQYRVTPGANTEQFTASVEGASVLQLERKGNIITVSVALKGKPLQQVGSYEFNFPEEAYIGLFVCAHNPDVIEAAEFSNVRLVVPAFEGFKPYQDYGHSRLEILEVETGLRKVIYSTEDPIEAPNWSRDGTYLIYNSKGLLFKIAANGGEPKQIPTDFAIRNNNDHGISFDGKKLAISHHAEDRPEGNNSTVYVLPIEGGTPKEMTSKSPSYWHGWSPDDQWLVYTGGRDGQYDIYKISINGGEEIRLTEADALDDGPEFSPDGKFIYFNSSRSGKMQIWRMNPDGSNQEQITKDEFNNWFAHPSPDGKQIIILSYPEDIKADDHPHYKHVMLRLLSPDGAEPVVKAYIYGGQGTINVPSWSPDSKKVAFVSYTFGKP